MKAKVKAQRVVSPPQRVLMPLRQRIAVWLAWKLPRSVAYWAAIRVATYATQGFPQWRHSRVDRLSVMTMLKRWHLVARKAKR